MAANAKIVGFDVTLVAAVIAAVAAITAGCISYLGVRTTKKSAEAQREHDYRVRQLGELYGPLYMRRRLSRRLWKQLPGVPDAEPGITKWRLIENIEEIKAESDNGRRLIVEEILKINDEITGLIVGSAGLLESFPPPQSFDQYLEHASTLRIHWKEGRNAAGASFGFPQELDRDIEASIHRLRNERH